MPRIVPAEASRAPGRLGRRRVLTMAAAFGAAGAIRSTKAAEMLTLYAAQHEQTVDQITKAFTKETGVAVRVRSGEPPELASELLREGAASPADVFFTANSPELTLLSEKHLLAQVDPATLARVPRQYSSPAGDWVGVFARVDVLVYNTGKIQPAALPSSLMDLADPKWKGRLAIAPTDADFLPLVAAVAAEKGRTAALDWLKGLKRNAIVFDDNEGVAAAVERGAAEVGIVNNYYLPRLAVEKGPANMHSAMYLFRERRYRRSSEHLRCGGSEVVPAPGGGPEVSRLPGQHADSEDGRGGGRVIRVPSGAWHPGQPRAQAVRQA